MGQANKSDWRVYYTEDSPDHEYTKRVYIHSTMIIHVYTCTFVAWCAKPVLATCMDKLISEEVVEPHHMVIKWEAMCMQLVQLQAFPGDAKCFCNRIRCMGTASVLWDSTQMFTMP